MRRVLAVVCALGAVLVACGGDDDLGASIDLPEVYDLDHDPTEGIEPVDVSRTNVLPAAQLRLVLEDLFVSHGITLVHTMQGAERGDGSADPWIAELTSNTDAITGAVGILYGPTGAGAFHQQWAQHTQFLVDYSDALRRDDDTAADEAVAQLESYASDSGSLLSTALGGLVSADDASALLRTHVGNMIDQIDAYHAGDEATATAIALEDNAYLVGIATALSGGFAAQQPEAFPGVADDPLTQVCSIAGRAGGDLALLALLPESRTSLSGQWDTATGDLDAALASGELPPVDGLAADEQQALLEAISAEVAAGDAAGAIAAVNAWREAVRVAVGRPTVL